MELETLKPKEAMELVSRLDELADRLRTILPKCNHGLNGERYLSRNEVCQMLHISQRTLQDYRDTGKLGYVKLAGKMLYKYSEIIKLLEDNYVQTIEG